MVNQTVIDSIPKTPENIVIGLGVLFFIGVCVGVVYLVYKLIGN